MSHLSADPAARFLSLASRFPMRSVFLCLLAVGFAGRGLAAVSAFTTESQFLPPTVDSQEEFGYSVAMSGTLAIVGAWQADEAGQDSGAAYAYTYNGTSWVREATLLGLDQQSSFLCGRSVAISGSTAIVGCWGDFSAGGNSGSAYVFVRSGGVWTQQAKLVALDATSGDFFGWSVGVGGNTAIVGAYRECCTAQGTQEGAAYIFERSGTTWTQTAKLAQNNAASSGGNFGYSVAASSSGTTVIIGDPIEGLNGPLGFISYGSAHIYVKSGSVWVFQAKLANIVSGSTSIGERRGHSVALAGNIAVIGAPTHTNGLVVESGSVYVYRRQGTTWSLLQTLTASDLDTGDQFGTSVSMGQGPTVLVGAAYDDDTPGGDEGSVYVFTKSGSALLQSQKLTASNRQPFDHFGWSTAVATGQALVGAIGSDTVAIDAGIVYAFK